MTKVPMFQPAPRPKPLTSGDDALKLSEATEDLGFTRPSTPPIEQNAKYPKAQTPKPPLAQQPKGIGLKLAIPDVVYTALRLEAVNRRVTVRYLVRVARAETGYAVDRPVGPEDGRRLR